jgi:hypothetical protein
MLKAIVNVGEDTHKKITMVHMNSKSHQDWLNKDLQDEINKHRNLRIHCECGGIYYKKNQKAYVNKNA